MVASVLDELVGLGRTVGIVTHVASWRSGCLSASR